MISAKARLSPFSGSPFLAIVRLDFNGADAMTDELSEANEQGVVDPTFRELVDGGRWHELLALLSKRIDHDSKNVRLRCSRGRVLLRMHDCEAAVRDFSEAVRLDPKSVRAHLGRGDVYLELRQFDAALDEYDRAIALEPERGSTYWSRGVMYLERNRATDAIADFTKAADAGLCHTFGGQVRVRRSETSMAPCQTTTSFFNSNANTWG